MQFLNIIPAFANETSSLMDNVSSWLLCPMASIEMVVVVCLMGATITSMYGLFKSKQMKMNKEALKKEKKTLDDYSYRDLFHFFINPENHWDKMDIAKEFSERMHTAAAKYMMEDHADNHDFPDHFTYIPYDKKKVNEKLNYIFERLFKKNYLDWCEAGQPVSSDSIFWWAQTKLHLTTYLIQHAPYHLTDGAWLRGVPQGPMSETSGKLFAIYIDEMGNGDISQNHCNVYLNVLESLGLKVPSIFSREFVDQQSIFEISFKKPLLPLTTSLFPTTYEPEILGYTLWLETTSPAHHAGLRKILERYNLSSNFSLLHTTIDNNVNGHGRYARDAVTMYLNQIMETQGEEAVQAHWKRIWTGYVAYGMAGNIDSTLRQFFDKQKVLTPRQEFIKLIKKKSAGAKGMHGSIRIGPEGHLLNDLFSSGDVEKICNQLENSEIIVKGDPGASKFLNYSIGFHGPMYQIFDANELVIVSRWILSLEPSTINDMISLVLQHRKLAEKIKDHIVLKLPDQSQMLLRHLFIGNTADLLAAFRASEWTIPFDGQRVTEESVDTCKLMKSIEPNGELEHVFNHNSDAKKTLRQWLLNGAPLPNETLDASEIPKRKIKIQSHERFKFEL
ncbi:hypothetical protein I4U23_023130 [Adineta vaga]|nr:hypothetical protein I4U23_023130 [Adineta vaga]